MDAQSVLSSIETLLSLHGWVAAHCPTLIRPFGQNSQEHAFDDLLSKKHLYFFSIIIHSADHFLVDQLAVIVQLAKRFGPSRLFVSMLDYDSSDSTATLTDLSEAVLILLGIPYRIRRVPGMTEDPGAAYYPSEEAYTRNLALEPLMELYERRKIKFHRVIWLKGFTCPNDILETIKVSDANDAAMVCGMDWAEHNGFFIFSDRHVPYSFCSTYTPAHSSSDGALVISTAISSVNQNHLQSLTPSRHGIESVLLATRNTCRSRCFVASQVLMSLTQLNRTTWGSRTAQAQISIMCPR